MSKSKAKKITLKDLAIRYENIKKHNRQTKKCSVSGCDNPRDLTPMLGEDTCCAYHRVLFDFWSYEVAHDIVKMTQKGRRRAFTNWMNGAGKKTCDRIVLRMAQELINWEC